MSIICKRLLRWRHSLEELKREQQQRKEAVERLGMLQTKEMRARAAQKELRKYKYVLIRVRMPDGFILQVVSSIHLSNWGHELQGTFRAMDRLSTVKEFIVESLREEWMLFTLLSATGHQVIITFKIQQKMNWY